MIVSVVLKYTTLGFALVCNIQQDRKKQIEQMMQGVDQFGEKMNAKMNGLARKTKGLRR